MRCLCCNRILNDYEATRRHAITGEFIDICNRCIEDLGIPSVGRDDLKPEEQMLDDMDEDVDVESNWDDSLPEVS
ncbi:MAG TPA: hypothetical protein VFM18_12115 [Methanosarcina sp.]|nr:hypothetical protein [Methanosarcina sp.]